MYTLTVYYNDATFSRGNVLIQVGKEAVVNVTVDTGAATGKPKGEVINIKGTAPIVDQGSTKTGITITDDYTRNIPDGAYVRWRRRPAAGAQSDNYGISFAGATSVENMYIVEGINTTDTALRRHLSSNLPNEFISETEVITGGYNAEFGRATGGIVNVVTKQGSNEFHGSVFGYFQPGAFVSAAKSIQREGGSIDIEIEPRLPLRPRRRGRWPDHQGQAVVPRRLQPVVRARTTITRIVQTQVDEDSDGVPDVDPTTGFTTHEDVSQSRHPGELQDVLLHRQDQRRDQPEQPVPDLGVR